MKGVWEASDDDTRKLKIDLYQQGHSDGRDLPKKMRRIAKAGMIFGKLIYLSLLVGAIAGVGYLGFWLATTTLP